MSFVLFSAFSGFAGRKKNFKEIGNAFQVKGEIGTACTMDFVFSSSWGSSTIDRNLSL